MRSARTATGCALILAVLLAASAQGATITQEFLLDPIPATGSGSCLPPGQLPPQCQHEEDWTSHFPNPLFVIDRFDPAMGELRSVTFDSLVTVEISTDYGSTVSGFPPNDTTSMSFDWDLYLDLGVASLSLGSGGASQSQATCEGPCTLEWFLSSSEQVVIVDDLSHFIGTETTLAFSDGGYVASEIYLDDVDPSQAGRWELTVTYTYVPEPSTGLLVSLGLAAVAARRRPRTSH